MAHRLVLKDFDCFCSLLLLAHDDGDIGDEELLLLIIAARHDAMISLLPPLQYLARRLCLQSLDEEQGSS